MGTEEDLENPNYRRLKNQFAAVSRATPRCRFVCLAGRRPDGKLFIFLDGEPVTSKNYSPPGRAYQEASASFFRVFDSGTEAVEGPVLPAPRCHRSC